jgi:hypothetical protein
MYSLNLTIKNGVGVYDLTCGPLEPIDKIELGLAFSFQKTLT